MTKWNVTRKKKGEERMEGRGHAQEREMGEKIEMEIGDKTLNGRWELDSLLP